MALAIKKKVTWQILANIFALTLYSLLVYLSQMIRYSSKEFRYMTMFTCSPYQLFAMKVELQLKLFIPGNRQTRLACLHSGWPPNSDHVMIHLGGYNCFVCAYSRALSCV